MGFNQSSKGLIFLSAELPSSFVLQAGKESLKGRDGRPPHSLFAETEVPKTSRGQGSI